MLSGDRTKALEPAAQNFDQRGIGVGFIGTAQFKRRNNRVELRFGKQRLHLAQPLCRHPESARSGAQPCNTIGRNQII